MYSSHILEVVLVSPIQEMIQQNWEKIKKQEQQIQDKHGSLVLFGLEKIKYEWNIEIFYKILEV